MFVIPWYQAWIWHILIPESWKLHSQNNFGKPCKYKDNKLLNGEYAAIFFHGDEENFGFPEMNHIHLSNKQDAFFKCGQECVHVKNL